MKWKRRLSRLRAIFMIWKVKKEYCKTESNGLQHSAIKEQIILNNLPAKNYCKSCCKCIKYLCGVIEQQQGRQDSKGQNFRELGGTLRWTPLLPFIFPLVYLIIHWTWNRGLQKTVVMSFRKLSVLRRKKFKVWCCQGEQNSNKRKEVSQ